jgi:hypothetical protein
MDFFERLDMLPVLKRKDPAKGAVTGLPTRGIGLSIVVGGDMQSSSAPGSSASSGDVPVETAQITAGPGRGGGAIRPDPLGVVLVRPSEPHPVAWTVRIATILATITGFGLGIATRPAVGHHIFATLPVHALVVLAICAFCCVGFWLLCRDEPGAGRGQEGVWAVGRLFATAGLLGSIVYLASSYADFAMDRQLAGGITAGWIRDVLFLPSIAALLPVFLATIPNGRWPEQRVWRWLVAGLTLLAMVLLLVGMLFEPHPFTHPAVYAPLYHTWLSRNAVMPISLAGSLLFLLAIVAAGLAARARALDYSTTEPEWQEPEWQEPEWHQIHWYAYGGASAIFALIPFLLGWFGSSFGCNLFSSAPALVKVWGALSAPALVKVWGALIVTPLALVAFPVTWGWKWRLGRIRRLWWAAASGPVVAIAHEGMVLFVMHRIEPEPVLGGVYAASLVIAVAFEPISELLRKGMEKGMERLSLLRARPRELWEEALCDVRNVDWALGCVRTVADELFTRWSQVLPHEWPPSQRVLQEDVSELLEKLDGDFEDSRKLIAAVRRVFDQLALRPDGPVGRTSKMRGEDRTMVGRSASKTAVYENA